ncbi:hypothetical protein IAD21_06150 [Abditibacteriota bacterium]|nr:hypothetical protein IAD21_06150 [Abditibacteriota bacterium]
MAKWENWLSELEGLSADDPVWEEFDRFLEGATQIASAKRLLRESAIASLGELLQSLRNRQGEALSRLGWPDLSRWQNEGCSSSQALRLVTPLNHFQDLLERYDETVHQVPATPQEFRTLRQERNALEDEILPLGSTLNTFFSDPLAEDSLKFTEVVPTDSEPEVTSENPSPSTDSTLNAVPESLVSPQDISPEPALPTVEPIHNASPTEDAPAVVFEPTDSAPSVPGVVVPASSNGIPTYFAPENNHSEEQATAPTLREESVAPEAVVTPEEVVAPEAVANPETAAIPEAATTPEAVAIQEPVTAPTALAIPEAVATPEAVVALEALATQETATTPNALAIPEAATLSSPPQVETEQTGLAPVAEEDSRRLRIFISSPGDVGQERVIAMRVVDRLQNEFSAYVDLEPILWEHEPLRATGHFQEQILAPSLSNIVVCILWSRLGTRLPSQFQRADGTLYASGTEWEFEDALNSYKERGTPDLMVYRKSAEPHASMSDERALLDRLSQKRALDTFIDRWFGNPQDSFKAAFHQFSSPDEFEQVLENHLRKLIGERLPKHVTEEGVTGTIRWHKGSPFRGLETFDPEHAPVFFGRTRAISEVSSYLNSRAAEGCAFVVVFGMSGSGKSSMVKAGLLPTLTQPGVVEGVGLWRWTVTLPSETHDPILGLAYSLLQSSALPELQSQGLDATELAALLREAPQRVIGPLRAALKTTAEVTAQQENLHEIPVARLAIVVDQLEEIFTQEGLDPEERRRFIIVLQTLARSGIVWVMATMRSDFFVRCAEIPELMELKEGRGQYHLVPPTFAELSQILTQPARSAGLRFEVDAQTGERLSDVLQDAAGKSPGALPLLEFTLEELFQRRTPKGVLTFEAYRELGGIEGALGRRAEEVFLALPMEVQNELPSVLRALVTVSEGSNGANEVQVGARRAPLSQLTQSATRRQMVEAFVSARLLTIDQPERPEESQGDTPQGDEGIVRVAHEALLRHWPRLQKWLSDDLEFLRTRARVMNSAAQWKESNQLPEYLLRQGRPLSEAEELLMRRQTELEATTITYIKESRRVVKRARNTRLSVVTGVLLTFIAVVMGFGIFSFTQWKKTERQKQMALAAVNKWTYDVPGKLAGIAATRPALKTIFQDNIKLLSDIEDMDPQTTGLKREKAANLDRMGDTWMLLGDSNQAKQSYQQSLGILTSLEQSEGTPASKRDLATSIEKMGDSRQLEGDLPGAQQLFDQSLNLRRELAETAPGSDIYRELSVSYEKLGGVKRGLKDYVGCHADLQQAWKLRTELAENKNDAQAQRDLFVCAVAIGDSYIDEGKSEDARKTFEGILPATKTRANLGSSEARRDLSALYDRLGDVQVNENKAPQALVFYKQSLAIAQDLARNQGDAQAQNDLLTSWERIGNIYLSTGNGAAALESFARALPLAQNLARDSDNLDAQQSLLDCYVQIGDVQLQMGTLPLSHAAYQNALRQYKKIMERWPHDTESRAQAAQAYGQLAYLKLQFRQPQDAITAANEGLALAPDQQWIAVNLVEAYVFTGQLPKAEALCKKNKDVKIQDVPFKQAVLTDIQQLSGMGLTHPDLANLRNWLLQN